MCKLTEVFFLFLFFYATLSNKSTDLTQSRCNYNSYIYIYVERNTKNNKLVFVCLIIVDIMASALPPTIVKRKIPSEQTNENQMKKGHWSAGLSTALEDESVRLYRDDLCTVIKDKFPKVCRTKARN